MDNTNSLTTDDITEAKEYLTRLANKLDAKSKEVEDSTRTLNQQTVQNAHDAAANDQRRRELDDREAKITTAEQRVQDNLEQSRAIKQKAVTLHNAATEKVNINDMRSIDLDKREAFLARREDELKRKETKLKDNYSLMERNLRRIEHM